MSDTPRILEIRQALPTTGAWHTKNVYGVVYTPYSERNKKVNKKYDVKTLKTLFDGLSDSKSKLAQNLLNKAEFLEKTLDKLKQKVEADGVIVEMCQGTYSIEREHPALRSYNTTIKNYSNIIKQLSDMLPKSEPNQTDGFDEFGQDDIY